MNDNCPRCGAMREPASSYFACGSGDSYESRECVERQLAQADKALLAEREAHAVTKAEVKQLRESIQAAPIGAVGYGLNGMQQKAIADLFAWQKESLNSTIRIGGAAGGQAARQEEKEP